MAVQTALLACGGILLWRSLIAESEAEHDARYVASQDLGDLSTFDRLADGTGHFLLGSDLVLAGGSTYLAPVVLQQAETLDGFLEDLSDSPLVSMQLIPALQFHLGELRQLVERAQNLDPEVREQELYRLLEAFDHQAQIFADLVQNSATALLERSKQRDAEGSFRRSQARLTAMGGQLGFCLVLVGCWLYLSLTIVRPIQALSGRVRLSDLNLPFLRSRRAPKEIRDLGDSFTGLVQDLQDRGDELSSALEARGAFLANTSHELRTPLNAILGFAELLDSGDLSDAEARDFLGHIRTSSRHLLSLIEDILDLSRIDAGGMTIEQIPCSPAALVHEVAAMLQDAARKADLEFLTEITESVPAAVLCDPIRIRQVLVNLSSNAIKFTETGTVRLRLGWTQGELCAAVSDTGIGISPDKLEAIFNDFQQAETSTTRRYGGTGLGLAISRRLARLMGGELAASSEVGSGSRFELRIPAPLVQAEGSGSQGGQPEAVPEFSLQGRRVLLVDDVGTNRLIGRRILERDGARVTEACDGQQACEAVAEVRSPDPPFDAILMDLQMPVLDGYEATAKLIADGYRGPILALTAAVFSEQRERALEAGCCGFVTKPLDALVLRQALFEAMAARSAEAA